MLLCEDFFMWQPNVMFFIKFHKSKIYENPILLIRINIYIAVIRNQFSVPLFCIQLFDYYLKPCEKLYILSYAKM